MTLASRARRALRTFAVVGALLAFPFLTGCASLGEGAQPAPLLHLVYCQLEDPSQLDDLQADCDRLLAPIPSVARYASGRHFDMGRANVEHDYDLFLLLGFGDEASYEAYLVHPNHIELVERWRPRATLRIHDVWSGPRD